MLRAVFSELQPVPFGRIQFPQTVFDWNGHVAPSEMNFTVRIAIFAEPHLAIQFFGISICSEIDGNQGIRLICGRTD